MYGAFVPYEEDISKPYKCMIDLCHQGIIDEPGI
jgi:hypothetical protein